MGFSDPLRGTLKDLKFRKTLSLPALLKRVRHSFDKVKKHYKSRPNYSLPDVLMSGLAVFGLKYPSLLAFDNNRDVPRIKHNLQHLYGLKDKIPSDTRLREVLDEVDPDACQDPTDHKPFL